MVNKLRTIHSSRDIRHFGTFCDKNSHFQPFLVNFRFEAIFFWNPRYFSVPGKYLFPSTQKVYAELHKSPDYGVRREQIDFVFCVSHAGHFFRPDQVTLFHIFAGQLNLMVFSKIVSIVAVYITKIILL